MEIKEVHKTKQALRYFIWQLLELVDKGEYVECLVVKKWVMDEEVIAQLFNKYRLPLLYEVKSYDYNRLDKVIRSHYPMLQMTYFDNGLLGLANACIEILSIVKD